jgi:hypothetical protein
MPDALSFGPATPTGETRQSWTARSVRTWFCAFYLILCVGVVGMVAVGGRPDAAGAGQVLDGPWRFHPGDDPAWADPRLDDRSWEKVTLTSRPEIHDGDVGIPGYLDGWRARGHPQLDGYGWYRRQVAVPPQSNLVLVGPPSVDDGYEMFWDGRRIGGVGKLSGRPRVGITRPAIASLPVSNSRPVATLAIRAFMAGDGDDQSGGLRTVPVLAPRAQGEALYRGQWNRTIAGYIVEAAEPAAMLVLALIALLAARRFERPAFARWLAFALTALACLRAGNAVIAWTDLLSGAGLNWQDGVILAPLAKLGWTMAWNQSTDGRSRRLISLVGVIAWIAAVAGALADSQFLDGAGRALFALSLLAIAIRIVRHGRHRLLSLTTMLLISVGLFASDLSSLGIPGIWFPFNIGVSRSQFAYALGLPLIAFVVAAAIDDLEQERRRETGEGVGAPAIAPA